MYKLRQILSLFIRNKFSVSDNYVIACSEQESGDRRLTTAVIEGGSCGDYDKR